MSSPCPEKSERYQVTAVSHLYPEAKFKDTFSEISVPLGTSVLPLELSLWVSCSPHFSLRGDTFLSAFRRSFFHL